MNGKMNDLMIDIETLSSDLDAIVVQIGACFFDRDTEEIGEEILINIDSDSCMKYGMKTSQKTLDWWETQEEKSFLKDPINVVGALWSLKEFFKSEKEKQCKVWSHATFDTPILHYAYYKVLNESPPWRYKDCRDIRTLVDLAGIDMDQFDWEKKTHNALDDAKFQVEYCVACFKALRRSGDSE